MMHGSENVKFTFTRICRNNAAYSNDVNNQQDATTVPFINLFNSALHVSGDKFTHLQEHFLNVEMEREFHLNRGTGRQQCRCIVPKAVYTAKKCY